jgi:hypothetical protein
VRAVFAVAALGVLSLVAFVAFVVGFFQGRDYVPPGVSRDISAIEDALERFAADHDGKLPRTLDELVVDDEGRSYLAEIPRGPYDNRYYYEPPSNGSSYRVYTLGTDDQIGGCCTDRDYDDTRVPGHFRRAIATEERGVTSPRTVSGVDS